MLEPGLHAVVLNYRQPDETLGCVGALDRAGLSADRIVVVDNASPDGSVEVLEARLRGPRLLQLPENRGYGAGNNAAIEALWSGRSSTPTHVFVVNPDVRVCRGVLEETVEVLAADPRRGGVTCVQHDPENPERLDPVFRSWLERRGVDLADLDRRRFIPLESLLGAAMLMTREAIERVGGFDPLYFMYAEEEDLARRFRYHGFEIGLACHAKVLHGRPYLHRESEGTWRVAQQRKSRHLFVLKDPFHTAGHNVYRVLKLILLSFGHALTSPDATLRGWWRELAWAARRALPALAHRRREMRGRAHLDLPAADPFRDG